MIRKIRRLFILRKYTILGFDHDIGLERVKNLAGRKIKPLTDV